MKTMPKILFFTLLLCLLGCSKNKNSNYLNNLTSSKWLFQGIRYSEIDELIPGNLRGMNVTFSTLNKLHAISSCNVFDGDYKITGSDSIKIENLATTKIFCADEFTRSWESVYYNGFKNSTYYKFSADTLLIMTSPGVTMIFTKEK